MELALKPLPEICLINKMHHSIKHEIIQPCLIKDRA